MLYQPLIIDERTSGANKVQEEMACGGVPLIKLESARTTTTVLGMMPTSPFHQPKEDQVQMEQTSYIEIFPLYSLHSCMPFPTVPMLFIPALSILYFKVECQKLLDNPRDRDASVGDGT